MPPVPKSNCTFPHELQIRSLPMKGMAESLHSWYIGFITYAVPSTSDKEAHMRQVSRYSTLTCTVALLLMSTGCTLKATFETISDGTTNFLSSTTPGAWFTEDGLLRAEHKVTAFTTYNQTNLEQDLARGHGEYVSSLGTLLGVPDDQQAAFHAKAQGDFEMLTTSDHEARVHHFRTLAR